MAVAPPSLLSSISSSMLPVMGVPPLFRVWAVEHTHEGAGRELVAQFGLGDVLVGDQTGIDGMHQDFKAPQRIIAER